MLRKLLLVGATELLVSPSLPISSGLDGQARAQTFAEQKATDYPRYNMRCAKKPKAGIYACKYPGNFYSVSAYTKKKKINEKGIRELDEQVYMRAAQLALENDENILLCFPMEHR